MLSLLALWTTWMLLGTLFYKFYSEYTWSKAFYMHVNVGWGLNWVLDDSFRGEYLFNQGAMQLFSLIHAVIGFIFILYFCIYVAMQLIVKKTQWLERAHDKEPSGFLVQVLRGKLPVSLQEFDFGMWRFNIIFMVWIVIGVVWYSSTHHWRVLESIDFVFST